MQEILILKTGALGDVLRTTSILPGLRARHAPARVTWVTAPGAVDLVRLHPDVARVVAFDPRAPGAVERAAAELGAVEYQRLVSLDDEPPCCALAARLRARGLSGATLDAAGERVYTPDVAPWFDMGLLSVHGKEEADRRKVANQKSHPQIYAEMLGIEMGKPRLVLDATAREAAGRFARATQLASHGPVIGLNTGAGGRWTSKTLSVERTVALARAIARGLGGEATFLVLGGQDEAERNRAICAGLAGTVRFVDAGTDNALLDFAARVERCDLVVTSDSLALHVALALDRRVVAFFAPTSAAEIELYGLGEKVVSTAPDYCSYRADADTSTLTVERLGAAVLRQLARVGAG